MQVEQDLRFEQELQAGGSGHSLCRCYSSIASPFLGAPKPLKDPQGSYCMFSQLSPLNRSVHPVVGSVRRGSETPSEAFNPCSPQDILLHRLQRSKDLKNARASLLREAQCLDCAEDTTASFAKTCTIG